MTDFSNIDNPYDSNLNRSSKEQEDTEALFSISSSGESSSQKVGASDLDNLWISSWIKSRNYQPKLSGFMIDGQRGYIEATSVWIKGDLSANAINIPSDPAEPNSFHVDSDGNAWWGCTEVLFDLDHANASAYILNTGLAGFKGATIDGTSTLAGISGTQIGYAATSTADAVPANLALASSSVTTATDGTVSAEVVLSWTALATNTFDHYTVRYKKAGATYYNYLNVNANTITIEGLVPNTSYNFGVASVNKYGTVSSFSANITQTTPTSTSAPATVTVNSATGGIQYVILEWTHNAESDLASYNIYRHTTNNSAAATLIGNCRTTYFVDGGRTGDQVYYYWVKAVNTSGLMSAAFSTVVSATPRNVENGDIASTVTIAASKVLIDGTVYLSNWRHSSDVTKIDGGNIYAGSVTTNQLNFTPVQTTDVIASINASEEGITITADHITISGSTTFVSEASVLGIPKVFYAQPTTPYRVGDLWVDGSVLRRCTTELLTGDYSAAHWGLAVAYTDDTVANTKVSTFVQTTVPTALAAGDLWIDSDDNNKLYRATSAGDDQVVAGEWVAVAYNDTGKIASGGAAADVNAGVTTISGGKISTNTLSAICADLGTITAGSITGVTITGGTLQTAVSGERVEITNNILSVFDSNGNKRLWFSNGQMSLGPTTGTTTGFFLGASYGLLLKGETATTEGSIILGDEIQCLSKLNPYLDNYYDIGSSSYRWNTLYVSSITLNGTNRSSWPTSISSHSELSGIGANDHHSSTSNGLNITPASVVSSGIIRPSSNNGANLGSSSYCWSSAYITTLYLNGSSFDPSDYLTTSTFSSHTGSVSAHHNKYSDGIAITPSTVTPSSHIYLSSTKRIYWNSTDFYFYHDGDNFRINDDLQPSTDGSKRLGYTGIAWYAVHADNYLGCALPTTPSGKEVFRKIQEAKYDKKGVRGKGHHAGKHFYFEIDEFPEEMKLVDKDTGEMDIELGRTLGVTVKTVKELVDEIDDLQLQMESLRLQIEGMKSKLIAP